ncbi:MAG: DUF4270 family protein [Chitinophagaceae bacterium]
MANDSALSSPTFDHYLGLISNDPFFGKTDARILIELKPETYPYTFINASPDSLNIDSVVLVLDYIGTHGDTSIPQTVNVYEIGGSTSDFKVDSLYRFRPNTIPKLGLLGSRTFEPRWLNDSIKAYQDTTINQLRIRLNNSFGQRLLSYDATGAGTNNAYSSDSAFREKFKGFALESTSGNAVMGFNLGGANTKLAIYYKDDNNNAPIDKWDTAVAYFRFTPTSASANFVQRDYTATPLAAASGGASDNIVYIQNTPGTYATIKIPGLIGLSNRVVHRAELIMEQVYNVTDSIFPPPPSLYLDAYDPSIPGFRTVPYDFTYDFSTFGSNIVAFGGTPFRALNPSGNSINTWRFNLTRYVQHLVNGTEPAYDFRVYAPVYTSNQYGTSASAGTKVTLYVNSALDNTTPSGSPVKGRVRLYGGDPTRTNPQRMRLRIVYSKI